MIPNTRTSNTVTMRPTIHLKCGKEGKDDRSFKYRSIVRGKEEKHSCKLVICTRYTATVHDAGYSPVMLAERGWLDLVASMADSMPSATSPTLPSKLA